MSDKTCQCEIPPWNHGNFTSRVVGVDETKGRYGEVIINTCKACGRKWLHYAVEYEAFSQSGRWYRGVVSEEQAESVTPESAVAILESLDWHLYGGCFFGHAGKRGNGRVDIDA